jgi:hypothetical protein
MADDDLTAEQLAAAATSPDNNYTGTPVAPPKAGEEESNYIPVVTEEDAEKSFTFFRHRSTSRFEMPRRGNRDPFKFTNHIAKIRNEDVEEFLESCRGLHRSDSGNIFQIRNIQNEVAINTQPQAFRKPASTDTIVSPTSTRTAEADAARLGKLNPKPVRPGGLGGLLRNV